MKKLRPCCKRHAAFHKLRGITVPGIGVSRSPGPNAPVAVGRFALGKPSKFKVATLVATSIRRLLGGTALYRDPRYMRSGGADKIGGTDGRTEHINVYYYIYTEPRYMGSPILWKTVLYGEARYMGIPAAWDLGEGDGQNRGTGGRTEHIIV